jgi:hypothetical protein
LLENVLLELNQDGKVLRRYVLGSEIDKRFWMQVFDDNENREIKTIGKKELLYIFGHKVSCELGYVLDENENV